MLRNSILGRVKIFVAILNISELHHHNCAVSNTINNFDKFDVLSLFTAHYTCQYEKLKRPSTGSGALQCTFLTKKVLEKANGRY